MNAKEQFERIISTIESLSNNPNGIRARDIAEQISLMLGLGYRDVGAIFAFLTGYSLLDYIKERKIMAAYKMLISIPLLNVEAAIEVSGYDNQSSFGKKFKEIFNMTPTEAFEKKDKSLYVPCISWDSISSNTGKAIETFSTQSEQECTKFGISQTQYAKIMEAADYQSLYGFNDIQSEAAFKIAEEMQVCIKDAFEFIDDFSINYCLNEKNEFAISAEKLNLFLNAAKELKYVYFQITHSVSEALNLIEEAIKYGYDLKTIDPQYLITYLREGWRFDKFMFLLKKFEELGGYDFDDFLAKVGIGYSLEDAAKEDDLSNFDWLDSQETEDVEELLAFEEWALEQTDYANQEKIDIDYDEDNPYYSDEQSDEDIYVAEEDG